MKRSSMLIIRFQNKVCTQLYALLNFRRAQCPYFICSVTVTVNKKKLNFRNIANLEGGTKKISESSTGIEPMTSRTHGGHSRGHGFDSCQGLRYFLCPTLMSCWIIHLSHFITELNIHHLHWLIISNLICRKKITN